MSTIKAVLFDLDGTLLDTVPDLVYALNRLRLENDLPEMPLEKIKPLVSLGSRAMVREALSISETDSRFSQLREHFLALYEHHLADSTRFFPNIERVLEHLDQNGIHWGIVTNKLTRHTLALLKALQFDHRPGCIICGDSLPTYKPDPEPIRYACELLNQPPNACLYVGDAATDVIASKAAGTRSLVALYGYIHAHEDPFSWNADGYIKQPVEIIDWLSRF